MSIHQIKKSDLINHSEIYKKIGDIILRADAEDEDFEPVQIITLRQYYKEKAYDKAWKLSSKVEDIEDIANNICLEEYPKGKEFIEIFEDSVRIGINASIINDEEVNKALSYLVSVDDFIPGQRYEIGEEKKIDY